MFAKSAAAASINVVVVAATAERVSATTKPKRHVDVRREKMSKNDVDDSNNENDDAKNVAYVTHFISQVRLHLDAAAAAVSAKHFKHISNRTFEECQLCSCAIITANKLERIFRFHPNVLMQKMSAFERLNSLPV